MTLVIFSCKSPASNLETLDLMSEGIPLKIKAPANAVVKKSDLGIFQDITIKEGDNFYIQITAGQVYLNDAKGRKAEELISVKELKTFSRVVKEDDNGFIFEKKNEEKISYDFRHVKIQGDTEYLFQTGLIGSFDLKDVELMYDAVK